VAPLDLPLSPDGVTNPLSDGGRIVLRPIRAADADELRRGFERLSDRSRYLRFFTPLHHLPDAWVTRLSDLDHRTHRAWVAYDPDAEAPAPGLGVGVARLVEMPDDPTSAEAAVSVTDDYQGRGIGRTLMEVVTGTAAAAGYTTLVTNVLRENSRMLDLVAEIGGNQRRVGDGASVRIEIPLDVTPDEQVADGALYDMLRLTAEINP
jgi:GNAT superfamily N-acetyltransferase